MKIRMHKNTILTPDLIKDLINKHKNEISRLDRLDKYYLNQSPIVKRNFKDKSKPNNKITNNYARYITIMAVGYFIGEPVQLRCKDENFLNRLIEIYKYNDETDINTTLATYNSKYGYSYELHYMDEKGRNRIAAVDPREVIYITDNNLNDEPIMAIRYYEISQSTDKDKIYSVSVYTKDYIKTYTLHGESLYLIEEDQHPFRDVPIVRYINNEEEKGDYEPILSLIDAYDKIQSDTANDFEYSTNSFLLVTGERLDEEQAALMKEARLFNFDNVDGDVRFITKELEDTALENYKTRLDKDIHKFSLVPNMTDENFSGNTSGVALEHKLRGLESITGIKEQKFRKGLLRRVELLSNVLSIRANQEMQFMDVEFVFTRNNPKNLVEIVDMATKLSGIVSKETQLDILPMVDREQELQRLKEEKQEQENMFNTYDFDEVRQMSDSMKSSDSSESN